MTLIEITRLVRDAGGDYRGIQFGTSRIPDQVLFNDPQTKTTLAVPLAMLSEESVRAEIARSRRTWQTWQTCAGKERV